MNKTAIILGATGLVGQALTSRLANEHHVSRILIPTRRPVDYHHPKIFSTVIHFDRLRDYAPLFKGDLMFSCLGTTRKKAGSVEAQRRVDLDYQYEAAELAAGQGTRHYLLVSSFGADAQSPSAYLKMKGELEKRVCTLPFRHISIFQPSLLTGVRAELRIGEKTTGWIMNGLCILPGLRRYRPIKAEQVAAKMIQVSRNAGASPERFVLDEISVT